MKEEIFLIKKKENKKLYNFSLKPSCHEQLEEISKHVNLSMSTVLECMIEKTYQDLKK